MIAYIAVLTGNGVGPEVTSAAVTVLTTIGDVFHHDLRLDEHLVGARAIVAHGEAISEETFEACRRSDAILFGAIGSLPHAFVDTGGARPEDALLRLRRGLDLSVNIRPVTAWPQLVGATPLRDSVVEGADILFVREMSGGLYYGFSEDSEKKPSRITQEPGGAVAIDTLRYTQHQIERVLRYAFEQAARRRGHVTSVDKANLLSSSVLWRRTVESLRTEYPSVRVEHMLVDAFAMSLMLHPRRFDVVVTENLFGDILTDEAAVIAASIGMLPSASIVPGCERAFGLYEPVHGSAAELAGRDEANPLGSILSVAMLLRISLGLEREARAVEEAVASVLGRGVRTPDIAGTPVGKSRGTQAMGAAVAEELRRGYRGE